jgi:hypothetical protein
MEARALTLGDLNVRPRGGRERPVGRRNPTCADRARARLVDAMAAIVNLVDRKPYHAIADRLKAKLTGFHDIMVFMY